MFFESLLMRKFLKVFLETLRVALQKLPPALEKAASELVASSFQYPNGSWRSRILAPVDAEVAPSCDHFGNLENDKNDFLYRNCRSVEGIAEIPQRGATLSRRRYLCEVIQSLAQTNHPKRPLRITLKHNNSHHFSQEAPYPQFGGTCEWCRYLSE